MSESASKPSWLWGGTPRRIRWTVHILSLLIVVLVIVIANFFIREFFWKFEATRFAAQAGATDAKMYYSHGSHRLLEIQAIDESGKSDTGSIPGMYDMEPAGRQSEGCDVYFLYQSHACGAPHRITQQSYLLAFNRMMRVMCANPQWFGPHGERLRDGDGQTNRPSFKPITD